MIREAVRKALAAREAGAEPASPDGPGILAAQPALDHPSHSLYVTLVNVGDACLIEPAVPCNHCGYCRTHGH